MWHKPYTRYRRKVYHEGVLIYDGTGYDDEKGGFHLDGTGEEYDLNGQLLYEGEFEADFRFGTGREYRDGHLVYEGTFWQGKRSGAGREYRPDGTLLYEGKFRVGPRCGQGKLYYPDGTTLQYEGGFQEGKRQWRGKLYWRNGILCYEGEFQEGEYHGQGKIYQGDGTLYYEGGFRDGKKYGQGKLYYREGTLKYEGTFSGDEWSGTGREYRQDGTLLYEGEFMQNEWSGRGKLYRPDGTLEFEGSFWCGEPLRQARQEDAGPSNASGFHPTNVPKEGSALAELHSLIGLDSVKRDVDTRINLYKVNQRRKAQGMEVPSVSMHMVFTGNPGTGKTTVARLLARIYHEIGLLPQDQVVEVKRDGLVAGYVGETALKTQKVIRRALGGVLFIDEAYTLSPVGVGNDFGQEAIDTLLKAMEDNRENLVVIVAGYTDEMRRFIDSNPGLHSRFTRYIYFEDYSGEELTQIFLDRARDKKLAFAKGAQKELRRVCEEMYQKRGKNFGNARDIRTLFDYACENMRARLMNGDIPSGTKPQLTKEDIQSAKNMFQNRRSFSTKDPAGTAPEQRG